MTVCNRVILTGRVANPPERSYRPDGSSVVQFSLEFYDQEDPTPRLGRGFIDIVAFDHLAKFDLDNLQRGNRLWVEGRLRQRRWQTPEGKSRSRFEVIATDVRMEREDEPDERGEEDEETH